MYNYCEAILFAVRFNGISVSVISGLRREVDENCVLLGCYAANSSNFLPTFRGNLSVPFSSGL
jgi:hypothetical protein